MGKYYVGAEQLLEDSFSLAVQVYESGFKPDYIVGVWRGGAPVGIAVQEMLQVLGVRSDHIAIRTSSYTAINQRSKTVKVHGLNYIFDNMNEGQSLLLVDDVYDTGLSLQQVIEDLGNGCSDALDIRIATPYFKPANNLTDTLPDFFVHQTDKWLVFPHELDGLSLKEIRENKPALSRFLGKLELSFKTTD